MEEGAINVPNEIVRSGTFPRTRHRQRASSAQDIDQRGSSSIPSFPGHLDLPTTPPYQQPDVSNLESNGFTNQRQEEDAGDASAKALWPLFVKIEPALSSLLRDLADWKAERKSQVESVQTDVKEASSTENVENSDQTNESNESNERAKRFKYLSIYLPLYRAGLKGDWQAAKAILDNDRDAVRVPITPKGENILHIAVLANRCTFVKEVLKLMCPEDLELKDGGFTALYYAAVSGNVKIAEEMVKKNSKLPLIHCGDNSLPLDMATLLDNRDMMSYLFSVTPFKQWTANDRIDILIQTITADLYDIAWKILQRDETLATVEDSYGRIALEVLAKKPFALGSRSQMSTWERCFSYIAWKILRKDETLATAEDSNGHIEVLVEKPFALGSRSQMSTWERCFSWYKGVKNKAFMQTPAHQLVEGLWKEIQKLPGKQFSDLVKKHSDFLFVAAELGNVEFLTILFRSYPDLIMNLNQDEQSLFHISISHRQESVFNLIYEIGALKDVIVLVNDKNDNNMLHFAGQLAHPERLNIVSGAALQMQRELLWFKEVGKIVPRAYLNRKNLKGQTPQDIFTETHKDLQIKGEKWMKATSNYCMLVATLITTVVFTAAFTVPGGNRQENGTPILLGSNWFMVFFISDTIALLSSSSSILIFLSILTSRYKEEDFLKSLPGRLVFGLIALFISIVGMVVAFSATCFLVYRSKTIRIPIAIIASASVPIILFVWLHYDLWFDIIRTTYWSRFLFGPRKHGLFS